MYVFMADCNRNALSVACSSFTFLSHWLQTCLSIRLEGFAPRHCSGVVQGVPFFRKGAASTLRVLDGAVFERYGFGTMLGRETQRGICSRLYLMLRNAVACMVRSWAAEYPCTHALSQHCSYVLSSACQSCIVFGSLARTCLV